MTGFYRRMSGNIVNMHKYKWQKYNCRAVVLFIDIRPSRQRFAKTVRQSSEMHVGLLSIMFFLIHTYNIMYVSKNSPEGVACYQQ